MTHADAVAHLVKQVVLVVAELLPVALLAERRVGAGVLELDVVGLLVAWIEDLLANRLVELLDLRQDRLLVEVFRIRRIDELVGHALGPSLVFGFDPNAHGHS